MELEGEMPDVKLDDVPKVPDEIVPMREDLAVVLVSGTLVGLMPAAVVFIVDHPDLSGSPTAVVLTLRLVGVRETKLELIDKSVSVLVA